MQVKILLKKFTILISIEVFLLLVHPYIFASDQTNSEDNTIILKKYYYYVSKGEKLSDIIQRNFILSDDNLKNNLFIKQIKLWNRTIYTWNKFKGSETLYFNLPLPPHIKDPRRDTYSLQEREKIEIDSLLDKNKIDFLRHVTLYNDSPNTKRVFDKKY